MSTVRVAAAQSGGHWFGIAWDGSDLVATAVGSSADSALLNVQSCLQSGTPSEIVDTLTQTDAEFVTQIAAMLGELEEGDESGKQFTLSSEHLSPPLFRILTVAAAIPLGYATTYGDIAHAAGSEARAVGRVMATNPLYPIVPCHRVVGSDLALVGYGGKQDEAALAAKLARLKAEMRGAQHKMEVEIAGDAHGTGVLTVFPVEWVVEAAPEHAEHRRLAAEEAAELAEAERQQLRLF